MKKSNFLGRAQGPIKSYIMDMDGVIVRGTEVLPGAPEFIARLRETDAKFLVLTNNSIYTPRDLANRLRRLGLDVPDEGVYTSGLATAHFLHSQRPGGTAYAIGESGLTTALHDMGYVLTEHEPDYVVLGETGTYSFERITTAIRLILGGARFIATNPDTVGPVEGGIAPATGSVAALIEKATGVSPYFVGKPNPLMLRSALRTLDVHSEDAVMIGDRMDTDIVMGIESGLETVLVLTGVTTREQAERYSYLPTHIVKSIADIDLQTLRLPPVTLTPAPGVSA
jgi:NagD protein